MAKPPLPPTYSLMLIGHSDIYAPTASAEYAPWNFGGKWYLAISFKMKTKGSDFFLVNNGAFAKTETFIPATCAPFALCWDHTDAKYCSWQKQVIRYQTNSPRSELMPQSHQFPPPHRTILFRQTWSHETRAPWPQLAGSCPAVARGQLQREGASLDGALGVSGVSHPLLPPSPVHPCRRPPAPLPQPLPWATCTVEPTLLAPWISPGFDPFLKPGAHPRAVRRIRGGGAKH